LINE
jgi:hypothetical protein